MFGTAGAGDAFGATFAAYLAQGHRIDEALIAASINSASVVQYVDTQTGLMRRQHLDQKIASGHQSYQKVAAIEQQICPIFPSSPERHW